MTLIRGEVRVGRTRPHGLDRRADGERLAVAIQDGAPVRHDLFDAQVARVGFLVQELAIEHLQLHGARDQHHRDGREAHRQHARARGKAAVCLLPRLCPAIPHGLSIT